MNCPVCGRKVKTHMTWFGGDYIVRCECGTRIRITVGIFKDKIVDWETIQEQRVVYFTAWNELYKCFGERMQQDELDLMDSVLQGVELDMQEQQILRRFPHFATKEADNEEMPR